MLELNKRTHKVLTYALVVLVLLQVLIDPTEAATKCHKCTGINCQRTTYTATEDCTDTLDSCVTVFQESMVLAQGCLGQLAVELRNKCEMPSAEETDRTEMTDVDDAVPAVNRNCHQCSEDLCNNLSAEGTDCLQCDSNEEAKCASDTESLQPQRCPISKAVNTYCYAKIEASRATRGCATDLAQQKECQSNSGCSLCSPSDINGCNRDPKVATNDTTSSTGDFDTSSGGSGTSNGGSSSSGSDGSSSSGTSGGDSNSGSSGTGGSGSSSGAASGGSDSGASSGTGSGGSSSGAGNGGSDSGAGSGSGTGGGGSSSGSSGTSNGGSSSGGSGSGTGGSDSNSGSSGTGGPSSGGASGGSDGGASSGTGSGGSSSGSGSSGSGSDAGAGGSDSNSGSGSGSGSGTEISGASGVSNKLFVAVILMALPYFI